MTKAHSQTLWQDVVNSLKTTAAAIKRWVLLCLNLRVVICTPVPLLSHRLFLRNAGFFWLGYQGNACTTSVRVHPSGRSDGPKSSIPIDWV
ncbi:MAG: hypothetical protein KME19_07385 [Microcoleus vaginatus WJT46-NPBG5]|nr:hypothetical protein [Microcoleus vaginatus WJT46-NPBG5]